MVNLFKKYKLGTVILFTSTLMLMLAMLLACSNIRRSLELDKIQRGFYSTRAVDRYVGYDTKANYYWSAIDAIPVQNFSIYKINLEPGSDTRGVYIAGKTEKPPLHSGRFFTPEEQVSNQKIALVGRNYLEDLYLHGEKHYIQIMDEEYEVIGILGLPEASRFDNMKWMPFGASVALSPRVDFCKIDANTRQDVQSAVAAFDALLHDNTSATIDEDIQTNKQNTAIYGSLKTMNNVTKSYLALLAGFILSWLFATSYWVQGKAQLVAAMRVLGFPAQSVLAALAKPWLTVMALATVCSFPCFQLMYQFAVTGRLLWPEILLAYVGIFVTSALVLVLQTAFLLRKR